MTQSPKPGDTWRPSIRHAEPAKVLFVDPSGAVAWADPDGARHLVSAESWAAWVERTGARREAPSN